MIRMISGQRAQLDMVTRTPRNERLHRSLARCPEWVLVRENDDVMSSVSCEDCARSGRKPVERQSYQVEATFLPRAFFLAANVLVLDSRGSSLTHFFLIN